MRYLAPKIKTVIVLAGMVVGGCATSGYHGRPSVDPAALVQINQALQIPSGRARVYLQDGAPIEQERPSIWRVYCSVLMQQVHRPGEPPLVVSPGRFEISQVREYNDVSHVPRVYVAGLSSFSEWPINVVYSVEMRLRSAEKPGVRALICSKHSGVNMSLDRNTYYPNLAEIRAALGDLITIVTP